MALPTPTAAKSADNPFYPLKLSRSQANMINMDSNDSAVNLAELDAQPDRLVEQALRSRYALIEHGLIALDRQFSLVSRFLDVTEGRDKLYKLLQNICRIAGGLSVAFFPDSPYTSAVDARLSTLEKHLSITRKALRLGNAFTFVRLFVRVARLSESSLAKWLALGRFAGLSGYFTGDNIVWASKIGLLQQTGATEDFARSASRFSLWCYILSIVCSMALDSYELWLVRDQYAALLEKESKRVRPFANQKAAELRDRILDKRRVVFSSYVKNVADLLSALNKLRDWHFGRVVRGLLGLLSAAVGSQRLLVNLKRK